MPNHIHMIVFDQALDNQRLHQTLTDFRKFTGHQLADYIDDQLPEKITEVIHQENLNDRQRQVWQPGWYAEGIVNEVFWEQKGNYIHMNPVRKGYVKLPEHWRHSSEGYWLNEEDGDLPVMDIFQAFD